jgi:glycosyltransferase involved in cell wall biosynthesis
VAGRLPALSPGRYRVVRPPRALAHRAGHAWEQAVLPLTARERLIYSPANLAPVAARGRNVVVIHDAAAMVHPEWYGAAYARWQGFVLPRVARSARMVITVSEFSREEIAERLGAERIAVIPPGVDERFRPDAESHIHERYILVVGTDIARKNLAALAGAAEVARARGLRLLAAGGARGYAKAHDAPGVERLGYVPDDRLPGLYAGAEALLMPSLHEGFGLPCIEAMAAGTPVVATPYAALPETCGDAALLAEPDQLAEALEQALDDPEPLRARGRERARLFDWDQTARATDALIAQLA